MSQLQDAPASSQPPRFNFKPRVPRAPYTPDEWGKKPKARKKDRIVEEEEDEEEEYIPPLQRRGRDEVRSKRLHDPGPWPKGERGRNNV